MSLSYRDDGRLKRRISDRSSWLLVSVILGLALSPDDSASADWEVVPDVAFGATFQTNPRLAINSANEESASGLFVDARFPMRLRTERTSASLAPRLRKSFFRKEENQDLEDEDYYLPGSVSHSTMYSNFGTGFSYSSLSLRTTEADGGGTGGRVLSDSRQRNVSINPFWSYQLSPANTLSLNGGVSQTDFSPPTRSRFDFDFNNLSVSFAHVFNARNRISVQGNFTKFDSEQEFLRITNDSTSNGLSVIFTNSISETLSLTTNLGWAKTESEFTTPIGPIFVPILGNLCADFTPPPCKSKSDSTNFVGDLSLAKRSELINYNVSIGQTITPNSNGSEVVRRTLNGDVKKQFTRRFSVSIDMVAFQQKDVGDTTRRDRDFLSLRTILRWQFNEQWDITARYLFSFNDNQGNLLIQNGSYQNQQVFLGLVYRSPGWGNR